jgi:hypothetical protein
MFPCKKSSFSRQDEAFDSAAPSHFERTISPMSQQPNGTTFTAGVESRSGVHIWGCGDTWQR